MNPQVYEAAATGAVWRDMSHFGRFRVSGADAAALLHHLTTNDIKGLPTSQSREAVLISNKGRILDWLTVLRTGQTEFLVVTSPNRRELFKPHAQRFILFRQDVKIEDVTESGRFFGVFGPAASNAVAERTAYATKRLPGEGFLIPASTEEKPGEPLCDNPTFNVLRVEAGLPVAGLELTEDVNPWEADFDFAISLSKGCYNGQEIIARLHAYKKVKQGLFGLRLERVATGERLPLTSNGKAVGVLTSSVNSPRFGPIGLGYVRNDWQAEGTELVVGEAAPQTAVVTELPFKPAS